MARPMDEDDFVFLGDSEGNNVDQVSEVRPLYEEPISQPPKNVS